MSKSINLFEKKIWLSPNFNGMYMSEKKKINYINRLLF